MQHPPFVSVLAVYPMIRGFAFVFFKGPSSPIDWGVQYVTVSHANRNAATLSRIEKILDQCQPDALVIEDYTERGSRRSPRIRRLYCSLEHAAQTRAIDVYRISSIDAKQCFASVGARTKHEIGQAVSRQFPEFAHRLPRKRLAWDSQQPSMGLFSATALGVVFYQRTSL